MGLITRIRSTFLKVKNGYFLIANDKGGYTDSLKDGTSKQYDAAEGFDGYLKSVRYDDKKTNKYGDQWIFDFIDDNGECFTMQLKSSSVTAFGLLNRLASIEEFGELNLNVSSSIVDVHGTNIMFNHIWVKNNLGKNNIVEAKPLFTKEEIPPVVQLEDKHGKPVFKDNKPLMDYTEKIAFFKKNVLPLIQKRVNESKQADDRVEFAPNADDVEYDFVQGDPEDDSPVIAEKPVAKKNAKEQQSVFELVGGDDGDDGVPF